MLDLVNSQSLGDALRDAVIRFKSNTALIEVDRDKEKKRLTYFDVKQEAERIGALLQEQSFAPDDRCAIILTNQSKWPISAMGLFWAGLTLVPIDYKLTPAEQTSLLIHSGARGLITEWPIWQRLKTNQNFPKSIRVFVSEAPENADLSGAIRWETAPSAILKYVDRTRESTASIVYSSGTGGTPKGCMLIHGNYLSQAEQLTRLYGMRQTDLFFSILPTNHAIDFMCGFILPFLYGGAVVHQRTLRPEFIASTMKSYGVTHIVLVPLLLKALKTRIEERISSLPTLKKKLFKSLTGFHGLLSPVIQNRAFSRFLLKSIHDQFGGRLEYIFSGGAFVDPQIAEFFYRLGLPVVIGYGLTEACTTLTINDLRPFRSDTVGKPLHGTTIEIRNSNDQGIGEVWVKGPTLMRGYLNAPELTNETLIDGWLKTGDLGKFESTGHLKLVGRAKNMIVTEGGKNVYPEDVEIHFDDVHGIQEQCIFSSTYVWPSGRLAGEKLFIVLRPKADELDKNNWLKELQRRNRSLADYKRVNGYLLWSKDFPRTASMKVKRNLLAEELKNSFSDPSAIQELES